METIPKVGILVGIASIIIFFSVWVPVTIATNEYIFAKVFFDENIHLKEMESTEAYKAMLERYPDAIITTRSNSMYGGSIEMLAYEDNGDNELRVDIRLHLEDENVWANSRCQVHSSADHDKLGTTPPEIIDDSPIPKVMFSRGEAQERFVADFVKYTNCLDMAKIHDIQKLEADHHIAIPDGTGYPGCEEDLSCFEPYILKIKVGEVVAFRNFDVDYHTVTSGIPEFGPDEKFDSSLMESGDVFLHKFTEPNEYEYFCMVHPWQTGKIIVHEK